VKAAAVAAREAAARAVVGRAGVAREVNKAAATAVGLRVAEERAAAATAEAARVAGTVKMATAVKYTG